MKTRAELIARTLLRLGVVGQGRPAYPNEIQTVDVGIQPLLDELQQLEIIYVPDPDNIADAVFESLAVKLADNVKSYFGVAQILDADGTSPVGRAEGMLRALGYGRYSGAIQRGEYM